MENNDDNTDATTTLASPSSSHCTTTTTTAKKITTLIFDVDDTLYDIHTGFTKQRNTIAVYNFMVEYLSFPTIEEAKIVRDEYFSKYHSTAKGLQIAEQDGRFPPVPSCMTGKRFHVEDLSNYWATQLDYSVLGGTKMKFLQDMIDLQKCTNLQIIAFSNGPRKYVIRVLQELGLWDTVFTNDTLFAVDDVLPHCKPEKEAFDLIFKKVSALQSNHIPIIPSECIMIEDSMKNIRAAKALGMNTVLVTGTKPEQGTTTITATSTDSVGHITTNNNDDSNDRNPDPSVVDIAMETVEQIREKLPTLWEPNPLFLVQR